MSTVPLTKSELVAAVLAELRKRDGCEGVDSVAILENRNPRSSPNWEISIIAASRGNPAVVQRAAVAVQKSLQAQYRLSDGKPHQFQVGDRVRLSELGRSRTRKDLGPTGTVADMGRAATNSVRVLFDGSRRTVSLHYTYIEPIGPQ